MSERKRIVVLVIALVLVLVLVLAFALVLVLVLVLVPVRPARREGLRWLMDKLGSWVDPLDTVTNGSMHSHGIQHGVAYLDPAGSRHVTLKTSGDVVRPRIFLASLGSPRTTRTEGPHGGVTHRAYGEPNEIELTATPGSLNGSWQAPGQPPAERIRGVPRRRQPGRVSGGPGHGSRARDQLPVAAVPAHGPSPGV